MPTDDHNNRRFIPACAGEHSWASAHDQITLGSSPRVRGTSTRHRVRAVFRRFIPACAGEHEPDGGGNHRLVRFIPACAGNMLAPTTAPSK